MTYQSNCLAWPNMQIEIFQYLLAILVADTALVLFTVKLLRSRNSKEGIFAMRGIYLGFLAGMLVYILGYFLL